MKFSVAWIFDHIDANWKEIDIADLVDKFNKTVAEIEGYKKVALDVDRFCWATVTLIQDNAISVVLDNNSEIDLSLRTDIQGQDTLLLYRDDDQVRWASIADFGGNKEGLLPAFKDGQQESLRTSDVQDYILDIDNKSITHRPDLWGHRGMAREIAALLDVPLRPIDQYIADEPVKSYEQKSESIPEMPYTISLEAQGGCTRFAGAYIKDALHAPSLLWMALRLARIDGRPIDCMVDITNYVMFDIGQPMHVFDADRLSVQDVVVRRAKNKEKLMLLGGDTIELTGQDVVIANGLQAISLAGIKGGYYSGISHTTKSVLLEAAHFDATTIRRTATLHKKRTEASARFEKSLDPNQNITALQRFIHIMRDNGFVCNVSPIMSVGKRVETSELVIEHTFIERCLGITLDGLFIIKTLQKLEFVVTQKEDNGDIVYTIVVPTWRLTKDISIKEDIVEEIGRFVGYDTIKPTLPSIPLQSKSLESTYRLRTIKQLLGYGLCMREVGNYAFYDESFLAILGIDPTDTVAVENPVSNNWRRLVTSLVPHLFKAVQENSALHDKLRFFEWACVWQQDNRDVTEHKRLAGVVFDANDTVDFYYGKELLQHLFDALSFTVTWQQIQKETDAWFVPYQTASIMYDGNQIGTAGVVPESFLRRTVAQGSAFIFEIDGDALLYGKKRSKQFVPLSKYPAAYRDMSLFVPITLTTMTIKQLIMSVDARIVNVELIDFFEKEEWHDKRAVTYHVKISDEKRTLEKKDVDEIVDRLVTLLQKEGVVVR